MSEAAAIAYKHACQQTTDARAQVKELQAKVDELTELHTAILNLEGSEGMTDAKFAAWVLAALKEQPECQHDWVDPSNKHVVAGDWKLCSKCGALKEKT